MYYLYVESEKKKETNELIYNTERDSDIKNKLVATKRER